MTISEGTANNFFKGAKIEYIFVYDSVVHIMTDRNAMISICAWGGDIDVEILGPDLGERERLRDIWTEEE